MIYKFQICTKKITCITTKSNYMKLTPVNIQIDEINWDQQWDGEKDEERESFHKLTAVPGVLHELWHECDRCVAYKWTE
jgi:hypothetical protein